MNGSIPEKAQELLKERFGHDTLIALATVTDGIPSVRTVNSYYEDGKFYVITYAKSAKMKQIEANPNTCLLYTSNGTFPFYNVPLRQVFSLHFYNGSPFLHKIHMPF